MIVLLLIIIGFIVGFIFALEMCETIPEGVDLNRKSWKKVQHDNIKKLVIGGLIGAILFPLCFML